MAMTVNPDAGLSAPDTFRDEGLYAFRFDLNGDAKEELAFKVRFTEGRHADGDEHQHVQHFEVSALQQVPRRTKGVDGRAHRLWDDRTLQCPVRIGSRLSRALAPDLFAGDAQALGKFRTALAQENRFAAEAWENRKNFFAKRNVTAIVLEVPTRMIGQGRIHAWATASLYGHAPEVQVSRWGLPLITNVLIPDEAVREIYNRTGPAEDREKLGPALSQFTARVSGLGWIDTGPRRIRTAGRRSTLSHHAAVRAWLGRSVRFRGIQRPRPWRRRDGRDHHAGEQCCAGGRRGSGSNEDPA